MVKDSKRNANRVTRNALPITLFIFFGLSFVICHWSFAASPLWRGGVEERMVALTFDDGPKPEFSYKVLDILDRYGVKATFFVVGNEVEEHSDIILRMEGSGHEIGNHTYSHRSSNNLAKAELIDEVKKCNQVIENIIGESPKYFRPPGGGLNGNVLKEISNLNLKVVKWTVNAGDYIEETEDFEVDEDWDELAKNLVPGVVNKITDGAIVLFHNGSEQTVRALPKIIEALKSKGFRFVTISELLNLEE